MQKGLTAKNSLTPDNITTALYILLTDSFLCVYVCEMRWLLNPTFVSFALLHGYSHLLNASSPI